MARIFCNGMKDEMAEMKAKSDNLRNGVPAESNGRDVSCEQVRKLVKKEGIEAKNLVSWHVPLNEALSVDTGIVEDEESGKNGRSNSPRTADSFKCPTPTSVSSMRMKTGVKRSSDYRSRHWSYLFDNLRRTVDAIYDTCYFDQSVIECKEAIMILENCTKDFYALIEYLNKQEVWEKAERPTAVAWEVRKTAGSPNKRFPPHLAKEEATKSDGVVDSDEIGAGDGPMVDRYVQRDTPNKFNSVMRNRRRPRGGRASGPPITLPAVILPPMKNNGEAKKQCNDQSSTSQHVEILQQVAKQDGDDGGEKAEIDVAVDGKNQPTQLNQTAENGQEQKDDEGWEVVRYSRSRRNSMDSSSDKPTVQPPATAVPAASHKPLRTSVFPRSAQEIRQTKASLGKMVYNRQYLADQRQKELEDKMKLDPRQMVASKRRAFATSGSSVSLPSLNTRIGINFSNPDEVKRAAQAMKTSLMKGGGKTRRFLSYQSMESVKSLESIREEESGHVEKEGTTKGETGEEATQTRNEEDSQVKHNDDDDTMRSVPDVSVETVHSEVEKDANEEQNGEIQDNALESTADQTTDTIDQSSSILPMDSLSVEPDSDEALKYLTEEEQSLAQEEESIQKEMEEERKSIDIEMSRQIEDTDDDADEAESSETKDATEEAQRTPAVDSKPMTWQELVARWEAGPYARPSLCWGDIVDMELAEVRSPGQAAQVHEKLSSPSRQRNLAEAIKKREERRVKAYEIRQQILEETRQRVRDLSNRMEEVQEKRRRVVEKKKAIMETRLAKAEENRNLVLLARVRKAHDEDEKVNEIAFINTLEADNKRLDVITRHQDVESRLQTIQEERQRRSEEKAAREAAAEERRKVAEEKRQLKHLEWAERTRRRHELIEQQKWVQERERQQLAREKAKEREGRLAELKAAQQATTEELLQRIQQKQEESTRRHEENLEQIKQRASEMSTPRAASSHGCDLSGVLDTQRPPSCQPYTKQKLCTVCNVLISSEVHLFAHVKGNRHAAALKDALLGKTVTKELMEHENQKCVIEASDEKVQALSPCATASSNRVKANKKRRQRIRQKLLAKSKEYAASCKKPSNPAWMSSQHLQKMTKASRDITKCVENCGLDKQWLSSDIHTLERAVGEIVRILSLPDCETEREAFYGCKLQDQALLLLTALEKQNSCDVTRLSMRSLLNICNMVKISLNSATALDMLYSNRICSCIDALAFQMQCLSQEHASSNRSSSNNVNQKAVPQETVVTALCSLITVELNELVNMLRRSEFEDCFGGRDKFRSTVLSILSYMVACGIVDSFGAYCAAVVDVDVDGCQCEVMQRGFHLVSAMLTALALSTGANHPRPEDSTQLLEALRYTELCNLMRILYSVLLSPNTVCSTGDRQTPPKMSGYMVDLVTAALDLVNCTGAASWHLLQDIFGQEGSSLEFRHVASFLISYGNRYECKAVLHQIIVSVGYFTVLNEENQALVHFGSQPSILQQLCVLPFAYFSDKRLTRILYPTLIACTYGNSANRQLLEQELNCSYLADFLKEHSKNEDKMGSNDSTDCVVFSLNRRFPVVEWNAAIEYFESPLSSVGEGTENT